MSWLMAAVYDRFTRGSNEACLDRWRAELLSDLSGAVLEAGAGTGVTLPHYPRAVTRLVLCEPDPHMRRKLQAKIDAAGFRIERIERESIRKALPIVRPSIRGVARKSG